jgi:heme A synthase
MNMVHTFASNVDETLSAQDEYTATTRMSHMYAFILICVIALVVLVITLRNLASDTVTTGGCIICCIILILFVISVGMYLFNLFGGGAIPFSAEPAVKGGDDSGPVIRIHYV